MATIELTSKKGMEVNSYLDSMLFYVAKGNGIEDVNNTIKKVPYGIFKDVDSNPFSVEFDTETRKVYMNPGEAHIYGRQIRLTERTEIFDFNTTTESVQLYCTIFFNLDLEDYTLQRVAIAMDYSGANWKDFTRDMIQDNVFKYTHGIYQAPICRFRFTPASGVFDQYTQLMPQLDSQMRDIVTKLPMDATLGGTKRIDSISEISGGKLYFNKASNLAAFNQYDVNGRKGSSAKYYSVATIANKIGKIGSSVEIKSTLNGVYTCQRITPYVIGSTFGTNTTIKVPIAFDENHIQKILIYLGSSSGEVDMTGVIEVDRKDITSGWGWHVEVAPTVRIAQCPTLSNKAVFTSLSDVHLVLFGVFHLVYIGSYPGYTHESQYEMRLTNEYDWQNAKVPSYDTVQHVWTEFTLEEDGFVPMEFDSSQAYHTKRKYADITFVKENGKYYLQIQGRGDSGELYYFLNGWCKYKELHDIKNPNNNQFVIECIYKGDARPS